MHRRKLNARHVAFSASYAPPAPNTNGLVTAPTDQSCTASYLCLPNHLTNRIPPPPLLRAPSAVRMKADGPPLFRLASPAGCSVGPGTTPLVFYPHAHKRMLDTANALFFRRVVYCH